jgi:hypothetical protein
MNTSSLISKIGALLLLILSIPTADAIGQAIDTLEIETLSGDHLPLGNVLGTAGTLIVVGFTNDSKNHIKPWIGHLNAEITSDARFRTVQVADLQGVPGLFRGFAINGIKDSFAKKDQDWFFVVFKDDNRWKEIVGYKNQDDAYLVLIGNRNQILWKYNGDFNPSALNELKIGVDKIKRTKQ